MPTVCESRLRACQLWPCSSHAILSLTPVSRPGLGTLAVDAKWRLYYDQVYLNTLSVEQAAGVILHEVCHCVLKHHRRFTSRAGENPSEQDRMRWNVAADFAVNDMLRTEGVTLRDGIYPEMSEFPLGMSAEVYYGMLERAEQKPEPEQETEDDQGEPDAGEGDEPAEDAGSSGDAGDGEPAIEGGAGDADEPGGQGDSGADPLEPVGGEAADGGSGGGEVEPDQPGDGCDGGGDEPADASTEDQHGAGGSCADGQPREYEVLTEDEPTGISDRDQDILVRKVAERLVASRGTGAGGAGLEWARSVIAPRVDPRRAFLVHVRNAVELVTGQGDYSYRRLSRRSLPGSPLPSSFCPLPRITVIVDTSGSMGERDLSLSLGLIGKVLKSLTCLDGVRVICGDAQVATAKKVFTHQQVELAGGGGTDMRVLIESALAEKPAPQLVIVATDGETPWPERGGKVPVVAAITREPSTYCQPPAWIKKVYLN